MKSQILVKSIELLSYIFSFDKINQLAFPIIEDLENGDIIPIRSELDEYYTFNHGVEIYNRMENLTIELAILLRRLYETSGREINDIVKFKTPGQILKTGKSQTLKQALNKIIHSVEIKYEVQTENNVSYFDYLYDKNLKFTGNLFVRTEDEPYQYIINMKEVCLNAFILSSIE